MGLAISLIQSDSAKARHQSTSETLQNQRDYTGSDAMVWRLALLFRTLCLKTTVSKLSLPLRFPKIKDPMVAHDAALVVSTRQQTLFCKSP